VASDESPKLKEKSSGAISCSLDRMYLTAVPLRETELGNVPLSQDSVAGQLLKV